MIKHFSPRAWLNSIYSDDNTNKRLFDKEERKSEIEAVSKKNKGTGKEKTDKLKMIENRSKNNLKRIE
jgi:hypothetical protein